MKPEQEQEIPVRGSLIPLGRGLKGMEILLTLTFLNQQIRRAVNEQGSKNLRENERKTKIRVLNKEKGIRRADDLN